MTKAELAAQIMQTRALRSAPPQSPEGIKRTAKEQRRLERLPKAELVALHAEYHHISDDTAALVELVTEALAGMNVIITVARGTVRVEQSIAEFGPARIAGFDATGRALREAGFSYDSGGCTCFINAL
ncbi:hypothetical protein [Streptomyces sp. 2P-4]|uniref:hypothetical protein n=1 Tax=Streptomyces sp. 2P-4 TaxID=2931974 RepID=UPI002542275B|nr:hypothetical protein [Streptomyces sp. 2P-4]